MQAANVDLKINKNGRFAGKLSERVRRSADPGNQTEVSRLLHITNESSVGLIMRPGGGAIGIEPGYAFFYDRYDRVSPNSELLDSMRHIPKLRLNWKFLPKTAIFLEGEGIITRYPSKGAFVDGGGTPTTTATNVDTNILNVFLGAAGSITSKISALIKVGYGDAFLETDNFRSLVAAIEGKYKVNSFMQFKLGASRAAAPTSLFRYVENNRVYAGYTQQFGGSTQLTIEGGAAFIRYGRPDQTTIDQLDASALGGDSNADSRFDTNITGSASIDHQLTDWFTMSLMYNVNVRTSNYTTAIGETSYVRNDALVRLTARY
ncbi:MAG: hypothetical protein R3C68_00785 [Myxococcota bacterium]